MSINLNTQVAQLQQKITSLSDQLNSTKGNLKESSFQNILEDSIKKVNKYEQTASQIQASVEHGDKSVAEAVVAMEKSKLAFKALAEVRNKLVQAYHDVWNMTV